MIMRSETGPLREGFLKGMIIALKLKKQLGISRATARRLEHCMLVQGKCIRHRRQRKNLKTDSNVVNPERHSVSEGRISKN